jgi:hypothetical protein
VREVVDNSTVESWAETDLAALSIVANASWHYTSDTITLSTLSMVAGRNTLFEITRQPADSDDTLVGDWVVQLVVIEAI